jgi:hypothetical protein
MAQVGWRSASCYRSGDLGPRPKPMLAEVGLAEWLASLGELLRLGQFQIDDEDAIVGYLMFVMALLVAALVSGWVIFGSAAS